MNPRDLQNASGRIQQKVEVTPGVKKVKDMIYVRSKPIDAVPESPAAAEQDFFGPDTPF